MDIKFKTTNIKAKPFLPESLWPESMWDTMDRARYPWAEDVWTTYSSVTESICRELLRRYMNRYFDGPARSITDELAEHMTAEIRKEIDNEIIKAFQVPGKFL